MSAAVQIIWRIAGCHKENKQTTKKKKPKPTFLMARENFVFSYSSLSENL
jgi:hypothetical protein